MEWGWLQSMVYGLTSGFFEFLPVSADAHRVLFSYLTGSGKEEFVFRLIGHASILLALLLSCRPQLDKLRRERKIASVPAKKRRRQPDAKTVLDIRLLKTALLPLLFGFIFYLPAQHLVDDLWLLAMILTINGIILFVPQLFPSGNKDSRSISAVDALLMGLGHALGVIPGISRIGGALSLGKIRGLDRQYAVDMCLLLSIPALIALIGFDVYNIVSLGAAISLSQIVPYILTGVAAFLGAYLCVILMRFLAVKIGFSGFSYYCWGTALFVFILYLTI